MVEIGLTLLPLPSTEDTERSIGSTPPPWPGILLWLESEGYRVMAQRIAWLFVIGVFAYACFWMAWHWF